MPASLLSTSFCICARRWLFGSSWRVCESKFRTVAIWATCSSSVPPDGVHIDGDLFVIPLDPPDHFQALLRLRVIGHNAQGAFIFAQRFRPVVVRHQSVAIGEQLAGRAPNPGYRAAPVRRLSRSRCHRARLIPAPRGRARKLARNCRRAPVNWRGCRRRAPQRESDDRGRCRV